MEIEDEALDRLLARLELAFFQVENNDPDVKWVITR